MFVITQFRKNPQINELLLMSIFYLCDTKLLTMQTKILIIGACGQIGTELTAKLRETYGVENVVASDIRKLENDVVNNGIFEVVNALDYNQIEQLIEKYH